MPEAHTTETAPTPRTGDLITPPEKKAHHKPKRSRSPHKPAGIRAYLVLIALILLVFSPILGSDLVWSPYDLPERSTFESMEHWQEAWTLDSIRANDPLTLSSYFIEQALPLPLGIAHHSINVLLHILAAILLLKNLEGIKLPAAFSATLVFALHPATVQTIFWSGYRSEILGLILILSALHFGIRNRGALDYSATVGFTALACIIHPAALCIPIILALIILKQKRSQSINLQSFNRVLPLVLLCLFIGIWINSSPQIDTTPINEASTLNATDQLNRTGQNIAFYTRQALVPINTALFHIAKPVANNQTGIQMGLLPFLLIVPLYILIACYIRQRWSRAILLGLTSYLLLIAYSAAHDGQFLDGNRAHEEHGLYIALPFIIALIIGAAASFVEKTGTGGKALWVMGFSVLLLIEISITASFTYAISEPTRMWKLMSERWDNSWVPKAAFVDSVQESDTQILTDLERINLLESILQKRPELIKKRILLARTYASEGRNPEARREYKRILLESTPSNELLEEVARFFEKVGLNWDAQKTRKRKTQTKAPKETTSN